VTPRCFRSVDVNGDHILAVQNSNWVLILVMLATPEIGGLPYVVSVLVAAGGLAAALSTADGLLLTIGNALAHDLYFDRRQQQSTGHAPGHVVESLPCLVVALMAAYVAAQRPAGILYLVSASFSLAGAAFVPVMVLGIFWSGLTRSRVPWQACWPGWGLTIYYMAVNLPRGAHRRWELQWRRILVGHSTGFGRSFRRFCRVARDCWC
jgi:cation/acetate symporter